MSFFWQDEDDVAADPLSQSQSLFPAGPSQSQPLAAAGADVAGLRCRHCDGTGLWYTDATTDRRVCGHCHAEAEPHVPQSQTLDYDEVLGLAAKAGGGQLRYRRPPGPRRARGAAGRTAPDIATLDRSVPLPGLEACLRAFQTVLVRALDRLLRLLRWDNGAAAADRRAAAHRLLKALWGDYLAAWRRGAVAYAARLPQLRVALRDAFLRHPRHRSMVGRALAFRALRQVRQEMREDLDRRGATATATPNDEGIDPPPDEPKGSRSRSGPAPKYTDDTDDESESAIGSSSDESDADESDDEQIDEDENDDQDDDEGMVKETERPRKRIHANKVAQAVRAQTHGRKKSYTDVALYKTAAPSMTMAAALLWLTVYRAGVTSSQMCQWIQSGSLPLANAFMLLDADQRRALRPIQYFFQLTRGVAPAALEHTAQHLAAVCRLRDRPDLVVHRGRRIKSQDVRFVTAKSLPHVLAQTIADLGLGPTVLHRCLVLVGLSGSDEEPPVAEKPEGVASDEEAMGDTTPPLSPERVTRLEEVVALIAIACLLDPDWRRWRYGRAFRGAARDRYVPWTPEQLHHLGNGPQLRAYLDFLEEIVLSEQDSYAPAFIELLGRKRRRRDGEEAPDDAPDAPEDGEHRGGTTLKAVRPYPFVAGVPPPGGSGRPMRDGAVDPPKRLLVEFLAHGVGLTPEQVQSAIDKLLS